MRKVYNRGASSANQKTYCFYLFVFDAVLGFENKLVFARHKQDALVYFVGIEVADVIQDAVLELEDAA